MSKTERFSLQQEENTIGIIAERVSLYMCVWREKSGAPSFVHPYSLRGRECVTYRKLSHILLDTRLYCECECLSVF